jgi:hypothetical protein
MKIGIVGSEEKYWTEKQREQVKQTINMILGEDDVLISGGCHKGGVDIWAEEVADKKGLNKIIFLPEKLTWYWYKKRNMRIAEESDVLVDIEPGDRKSGGYWTLNYAKSIGKVTNHIKIRR